MATKDKEYVCVIEYQGAITGTLDDILEQIEDECWNLGDCEFYELGEKVNVKLTVEK